MSGMYYPESWMQHPEVLRLQQRIRDLENGVVVDELQKTIKRNEAEIDFLKDELFKYMSNSKHFEERLKKESDFCNSILKETKKFNKLSPIKKMFHRFNIE